MLHYLLLTNGYALLLYGVFYFLLRNKVNFAFSRIYLVLIPMVAVTMPLFKLNGWNQSISLLPSNALQLPEVVIGMEQKMQSQLLDVLQWHTWLSVYIVIAAVLLIRLLYQIDALQSLQQKGTVYSHGNYKIITNSGIGPASWRRNIFFPNQEVNDTILKHEMTHIRLGHGYDKLFIQVMLCLFFPVLAFYAIKKSMYLVHEYEADAEACTDNEAYSKLLLAQYFQSNNLNILNTFFHHPLKNRIMMLSNKRKLNTMQKAIIFCCSTTLIAGVLIFQSNTKTVAAMTAVLQQPNTVNDSVFTSSEKFPQFPGGQEAMYKYISENIEYPESDFKNKIQGKAVVKFVVDKTGKIKQVTIVRGVSQTIDNEAIRVVKQMPDWSPGINKEGEAVSVYFTLPISFKLPKE